MEFVKRNLNLDSFLSQRFSSKNLCDKRHLVIQQKSKLIIIIALNFLLLSCEWEYDSPSLPETFQNLENLNIYHADSPKKYNIQLIQETVYGNSDKGELIGRMGVFSVDEQNRVYISDAQQFIVHVFESDGSYSKKFGRQGKGPGEFQSPPIPAAISGYLYIYDHMQFRIHIFLQESLGYSHAINLSQGSIYAIEELYGFYLSRLYFRNDGMYVAAFNPRIIPDPDHPWYNLDDNLYIKYYLLDKDGRLFPDKIFKHKDFKYLTKTVSGEFLKIPDIFSGKTLITISDDGHIYSADPQDFLVEVRNPNGEELYSFYYPVQKKELHRREMLENYHKLLHPETAEHVIDSFERLLPSINVDELPKFWPIINNLLIDNKNRIWISTIVEDFHVYEWWVLENTGELITKFEWPRNEPIEVVNNGYIYTRETDEETGLQQVVRYRIEFDEVN
jgi:hypothetical protein